MGTGQVRHVGPQAAVYLLLAYERNMNVLPWSSSVGKSCKEILGYTTDKLWMLEGR